MQRRMPGLSALFFFSLGVKDSKRGQLPLSHAGRRVNVAQQQQLSRNCNAECCVKGALSPADCCGLWSVKGLVVLDGVSTRLAEGVGRSHPAAHWQQPKMRCMM
eukprot:3813754-Amphidinium_carterae.1